MMCSHEALEVPETHSTLRYCRLISCRVEAVFDKHHLWQTIPSQLGLRGLFWKETQSHNIKETQALSNSTFQDDRRKNGFISKQRNSTPSQMIYWYLVIAKVGEFSEVSLFCMHNKAADSHRDIRQDGFHKSSSGKKWALQQITLPSRNKHSSNTHGNWWWWRTCSGTEKWHRVTQCHWGGKDKWMMW